MSDGPSPKVAVVDYGMGNLFSVTQACIQAGLMPQTTASRREILEASAVVLPGVGAFGDAIRTLMKLDLDGVLRDVAASGTPLIGICLGMQLMMTESQEFGSHRGLGIIEGQVVKLQAERNGPMALKVPQVGWNRIHQPGPDSPQGGWDATLLSGIPDGEYMYFVHSYCAEPADDSVIGSLTRYGPYQFCSSIQKGAVFGCQFHPERSGPQGLKMYQNLARTLEQKRRSS